MSVVMVKNSPRASAHRVNFVRKIADHFIEQPVGTVVTYDSLSKLIGVSIKSRRDYLQGAIVKLREEGIEVLSVRGVGYKRATGGDVIEAVPSEMSAIHRRATKIGSMVENAMKQNLTTEEHKVAGLMLAKSTMLRDLSHNPKSERIPTPPLQADKL